MANIREKIREARQLVVGACGKKDSRLAMRTWKIEVGGHRKTGRPKLRWSDVIRKDMKEAGEKMEEAQDWRTCRLKTICANPK